MSYDKLRAAVEGTWEAVPEIQQSSYSAIAALWIFVLTIIERGFAELLGRRSASPELGRLDPPCRDPRKVVTLEVVELVEEDLEAVYVVGSG